MPSILPAFADESWQWAEPTPGAPNTSATLAPSEQTTITNELPLGSFTIVVNEIFPAGSKLDLEFVELYNYGAVDVDISGFRLLNKAGKSHILPKDTIVKAKSYLVVKGIIPLTDTAETVILMRDTEELDRIEFTNSLSKGEMSIGRYCDVYELRFCEVKRSVPTPGFENALEPLSVNFTPANAVLVAGEKVEFTSNIAGARIILTQNPTSINPADSFTYNGPFTVKNGDVYWYFAQYEGQATIPQKVTFRVENAKPASAALRVNEVMVDALTKRGWVEVYNSSQEATDISALHIDTRARVDTLCTNCGAFVQSQKIAAGGYALFELPKATVTQLLGRKTPIEVRLMNRLVVLDTLTMPLSAMKGQWKSWGSLQDSLMLSDEDEATASWSDMPTPGVANVHVNFDKSLNTELLTKQVLARLVYAQAAYEDDVLIVRGKTLPGAVLSIWGNGEQISEIVVPKDGLWSASFNHEKTKGVPHLLFQLKMSDGVLGVLSAPFPIPAYDAEDPRQALPKKVMSAGGSKAAASLSLTRPSAPVHPIKVPFEHVPLLSSMTGVVLSEMPTNYNIGSSTIAPITESFVVLQPVEKFLQSLTTALIRTLAIGLSQ